MSTFSPGGSPPPKNEDNPPVIAARDCGSDIETMAAHAANAAPKVPTRRRTSWWRGLLSNLPSRSATWDASGSRLRSYANAFRASESKVLMLFPLGVCCPSSRSSEVLPAPVTRVPQPFHVGSARLLRCLPEAGRVRSGARVPPAGGAATSPSLLEARHGPNHVRPARLETVQERADSRGVVRCRP